MEAEIRGPWNLKEVLFTRRYPGYVYRRELVDDSEYGGDGNLEMVNCYSRDTGHWISTGSRHARFLCLKKGLRQVQKSEPSHCVCSVGFNEEEQKWYGWSHRAICGFGIGDKVFEERFGDDSTPFVRHGRRAIKNMDHAKEAAKAFAESVS